MATGAEDTTTTTTTNTTSTTAATTSDIFCRGLRRLLDKFIINERDLDLGDELGKGISDDKWFIRRYPDVI